MNFRWELEAGVFIRGAIRQKLDELEFELLTILPSSKLLIKEYKHILSYTFILEAYNITDGIKTAIEAVLTKLKEVVNDDR